MRKWALWIAVGAFLAVAVAGTVTRQVRVRDKSVRGSMVSLSPNVTEIVFALGLQDHLIGVSTACDYPAEAKRIRKVGDFGAPKIELIYALKPELVMTTSLRDPEAAQAIRRSGARLLIVPQNSIDEVPGAMETIGAAAGIPNVAGEYARIFRERVARATVDVPADRRPRVFVELSEKPLRTAARGSFVDDLIHRAGGRNIARDLGKPWTTISPDTVVARDPQIIIVAHPFGEDAPSWIASRIGWAGVAAVKSGRVITDLDPDLILRPGPRLADGLEALARLFAGHRRTAAP